MAHTQGPWAVKHERWVVATRGEHDGEIIVAPTYWMESSEAEAAANACLIAAAPDLLAALRGVLPFAEHEMALAIPKDYREHVTGLVNAALAAIAKATS